VVVGTWTVNAGTGCTGNASGAFIMCQDKASCTPATSAAAVKKF